MLCCGGILVGQSLQMLNSAGLLIGKRTKTLSRCGNFGGVPEWETGSRQEGLPGADNTILPPTTSFIQYLPRHLPPLLYQTHSTYLDEHKSLRLPHLIRMSLWCKRVHTIGLYE